MYLPSLQKKSDIYIHTYTYKKKVQAKVGNPLLCGAVCVAFWPWVERALWGIRSLIDYEKLKESNIKGQRPWDTKNIGPIEAHIGFKAARKGSHQGAHALYMYTYCIHIYILYTYILFAIRLPCQITPVNATCNYFIVQLCKSDCQLLGISVACLAYFRLDLAYLKVI